VGEGEHCRGGRRRAGVGDLSGVRSEGSAGAVVGRGRIRLGSAGGMDS